MERETLATVALVSIVLYAAVTLGGRTLLQRRNTEDSGWRGISGAPGSAGWWGGVLLGLAAAGFLVPPLAALLTAGPVIPLPRVVLGGVVFLFGFVFTLHAQVAMGRSWRIGVREGEHTVLQTGGPFRWCRNPVFTAMLLSIAGLAVWVPWLVVPWLLMAVALQLQVRTVEEPYLLAEHADTYRDYAARTGRFLPGVGRGL